MTPEPARRRAAPAATTSRPVGGTRAPTRTLERALLREGHLLVAGVDEVGRGALAGPVSVGVVLVDARTRTAPRGLRDSKLLTPAAREALVVPVRRWCVASAIGHASPAEIDAWGIVAALRTAAYRALAELRDTGHAPDAVILDGSHDWLSPPLQGDLLEAVRTAPAELAPEPCPTVRVRVKADLTCAVVAAASVLAKCERDGIMTRLDDVHPGYGWAVNKGYAVPEHTAALRSLGPSAQHRVSWRLPTGEPEDPEASARHAGPRRDAVLAGGMMEP